MTTTHFINLCLTFIMCVSRIAGAKHEAFQAIDHLYTGGLFGYWLKGIVKLDSDEWYFYLFLGACAVEVMMGIVVPIVSKFAHA